MKKCRPYSPPEVELHILLDDGRDIFTLSNNDGNPFSLEGYDDNDFELPGC